MLHGAPLGGSHFFPSMLLAAMMDQVLASLILLSLHIHQH